MEAPVRDGMRWRNHSHLEPLTMRAWITGKERALRDLGQISSEASGGRGGISQQQQAPGPRRALPRLIPWERPTGPICLDTCPGKVRRWREHLLEGACMHAASYDNTSSLIF